MLEFGVRDSFPQTYSQNDQNASECLLALSILHVLAATELFEGASRSSPLHDSARFHGSSLSFSREEEPLQGYKAMFSYVQFSIVFPSMKEVSAYIVQL